MSAILIGRNAETTSSLDREYGNRHGMIAGATGTGKSVSLMLLAEGFSKLGVPRFLADAKGDLAGMAMAAADEAHLLFENCPASLRQRVEQVVRLIRSKGVGVYFCSQNPDDVPEEILGQLGNRVQHALRAFTPRDQKAVRAAAETFVTNPKLDVREAIIQLGVGEALVSTLGESGVPQPVQQVLVSTPGCRIGTVTEAERVTIRQRSPVGEKYDVAVNRESASEMLAKRAEQKSSDAQAVAQQSAVNQAPSKSGAAATRASGSTWSGAVHDALLGNGRRQGMIEAMGKSAMRSVGNQLGRQILRGVLGGIFGGKR